MQLLLLGNKLPAERREIITSYINQTQLTAASTSGGNMRGHLCSFPPGYVRQRDDCERSRCFRQASAIEDFTRDKEIQGANSSFLPLVDLSLSSALTHNHFSLQPRRRVRKRDVKIHQIHQANLRSQSRELRL